MTDFSQNDYIHYVILLSVNKGKQLTEPIIREHVSHLRNLDEQKQLVLCGPFLDYKGGMIIIKAKSIEEAREIAESDPFVKSGIESYEIRTLEISCEENNHHGMG